MSANKKILITAALPYANGMIHLGHLVEYLQADIWARAQRAQGHDCLYICGNDAHGTPIMLAAQQQQLDPVELIKKFHAEHLQDFQNFFIEFDNFYTTHSPENEKLVGEIYAKLNARNDIFKKTITQAYDETAQMFLPDRFVRGTCPKCSATDQYGDNCEACGAAYSPLDLIDPISVVSKTKPVAKESEHYFFNLENYRKLLEDWVRAPHVPAAIANKLREWFNEPLKPWDISRDKPYFGIAIPGTTDKYFYVWLDAPIGYLASLENLSQSNPTIKLADYWGANSKAEIHHFIGKDIVYFHALFWPALLHGAGMRLPNRIHVHGYLTINGQKMSKSRGTFITARDYLTHFNPEYLRYYFAAKLSPQIEDIDLNWQDFMARVNADLVGKYVNLASRCAGFINKQYNQTLSAQLEETALYNEFVQQEKVIFESYNNLNYQRAIREIMQLADRANQYIDAHKPWLAIKDENNREAVHLVCTQGLNLFKLLTWYLKPVLPQTAQKVEQFFNIPALTHANWQTPLLNHKINPFEPLMQRVTPQMLEQFNPAT